MALLNDLIFRVGARAYDVLTRQDYWRIQIGRLLDHVDDADRPLRLLDLGCGPGISTFVLASLLNPKSRVVGLDASPEMIGRAKRHLEASYPHLPNIEFLRADASQMPFEDESFDLITGHSFLYLVAARSAVLGEALRVLVPGGLLVFMEPSREGSLLTAGFGVANKARLLWEDPLSSSRFVSSMVLWRLVSGLKGRLSVPLLDRLFEDAGFAEMRCVATLGGLGWHVVARKGGGV
jgi:ubiquinone/menaquinone biosynthesis C-methylase UbiE